LRISPEEAEKLSSVEVSSYLALIDKVRKMKKTEALLNKR